MKIINQTKIGIRKKIEHILFELKQVNDICEIEELEICRQNLQSVSNEMAVNDEAITS